MTNVHAIIITIWVWIITVIAWLSIIFWGASAWSMDCFNLSISKANLQQAKQEKNIKKIIKFTKAVNQQSKFCLSN